MGKFVLSRINKSIIITVNVKNTNRYCPGKGKILQENHKFIYICIYYIYYKIYGDSGQVDNRTLKYVNFH